MTVLGHKIQGLTWRDPSAEERPKVRQHRMAPSFSERPKLHPGGIRLKLALIILVLIALITFGTSLVVSHVLDDALMHSLVQRGSSVALSAATSAGYSILSGDHLALDNLAANITKSQQDIAYLAILDLKGTILAHSRLEASGGHFPGGGGTEVAAGENFSALEVRHEGRRCFEFWTPIRFAGSKVGDVVVGIDAGTLHAAKLSARHKVFWISFLALAAGLAGTLILAALITAPIKRLAAGVGRIRSGDYGVEVKVTSRDELGELTTSFNAMASTIKAQKESLEGYARELEDAYVSTVRILAAALDARDNYTLGHSTRVARLSLLVGRRLGMSEAKLKELELACFLHDIGKIRVSDQLLNKPSPLTGEEVDLLRRHPDQGAEILGLAESLHKYVPVVRHHHEWFDGSGYPSGLKGKEIPLYAQIVAIADAYDAMTTSRPYRPGNSQEEAIEEIRRFRGRQFAPVLADLFIDALRDGPGEKFSFSVVSP
jgi:HD-GYP domain-containing protein (c-di-GMP phosphodiesterase class II)